MRVRHLPRCPTEQEDDEEEDRKFNSRKSHKSLQIPVNVELLGIYLLNMNNIFADCQVCILTFVKEKTLHQRGQLFKRHLRKLSIFLSSPQTNQDPPKAAM